jgi:hypothetical protein
VQRRARALQVGNGRGRGYSLSITVFLFSVRVAGWQEGDVGDRVSGLVFVLSSPEMCVCGEPLTTGDLATCVRHLCAMESCEKTWRARLGEGVSNVRMREAPSYSMLLSFLIHSTSPAQRSNSLP